MGVQSVTGGLPSVTDFLSLTMQIYKEKSVLGGFFLKRFKKDVFSRVTRCFAATYTSASFALFRHAFSDQKSVGT